MDKRVEVHGTSRADINGKRGVATDFHWYEDESKWRYTVQLDSGEAFKLKRANVRAEGTGGARGVAKGKMGRGREQVALHGAARQRRGVQAQAGERARRGDGRRERRGQDQDVQGKLGQEGLGSGSRHQAGNEYDLYPRWYQGTLVPNTSLP